MAAPRASAKDPFSRLAPLLGAVSAAPFPPCLSISGDDEWIVAEASRRVVSAYRKAFPEGECAEYEGSPAGVKEAIADASTMALFATNRLVVLDGADLFRTRKPTAEELDSLLDEAREAGLSGVKASSASSPDRARESRADRKALERLSRKARAMLSAAGLSLDADAAEAARKLAGKVRRVDRASELTTLLLVTLEDSEPPESSADRLLDYISKASAGDNTLLVRTVQPDPEHRVFAALSRAARSADFSVSDDAARRERLSALGLERAVERSIAVDPEVFEILTERGRLFARPFLLELDRLIDSAPGRRVTAEAAARLIADERKEYGSDFVEAVAERRFLGALAILERLLSGDEFSAFRPFGGKDKEDAGAPRKGVRGEAAFFPLLGLLGADIRRMLALKAASAQAAGPSGRSSGGSRPDYRTFTERVLPAFRSPRPGLAPLLVDGHPFVLHKAYLAAAGWTLDQLIQALCDIEAIDQGVKTGAGTGRELLESFLLARCRPGSRA